MNDTYRPNWKQFEEHTKEILELCGLRPSANVKIMGRQTDIWCKASDSLLYVRILVECKSTKGSATTVPIGEITDFCARLSLARSTGVAELGWLITNGQLPSNSSTVIREAHLQGACELFTLDSLLSKIVDFSSYYAQMRLSVQENPIGFIDPPAFVVDAGGAKFGGFLDCCANWILDDSPEVMLLLGDYGQGKTTCCEQLLESYLGDKKLVLGRVPLYIRLRDVANQGYTLPAILRVCLQEQSGLSYHSFNLIKYLANAGRLIFIFDGLDEVSYTGFWTEVFPPLRQILTISSRKNKILITSRPGVFASGNTVSMTLDSLLPRHDKTRSITVQLGYFDRPRVATAIERHGFDSPQDLADKLYANESIADLIRRPITLRMVLESLANDQHATEGLSSSSGLYRSYTSTWLQRDAWRSHIQQLSLQKGKDFKVEFVQSLAWKMLTSRSLHVSSDFIDEAVQEHFGPIKGIAELLPAFANEIRLCSFLDWRLDGSLVFAHKSFCDYFVARHVAEMQLDEQVLVLSQHIFERTALTFIGQMIDWSRILRSDLCAEQLRSSSVLCYNAILITSVLQGQLALTVTLPEAAEVDFSSPHVVVLTVQSSSFNSLRITSESSVQLELIGVHARHIDIKSSESTRLVFRDCTIGNLACSVATHLDVDAESAVVKSGDLTYEALHILRCVSSKFEDVWVGGPATVVFSEPPLNAKMTREQRLIGLGFSIRRGKSRPRRPKPLLSHGSPRP